MAAEPYGGLASILRPLARRARRLRPKAWGHTSGVNSPRLRRVLCKPAGVKVGGFNWAGHAEVFVNSGGDGGVVVGTLQGS